MKAALRNPPLRCLHILYPGRAHCPKCGKQILFIGLERPRWQRIAAWAVRIATWLLGTLVLIALVILVSLIT